MKGLRVTETRFWVLNWNQCHLQKMKKGVSMPHAKYILADFLMFEFSVVLLTMKVTILFARGVCKWGKGGCKNYSWTLKTCFSQYAILIWCLRVSQNSGSLYVMLCLTVQSLKGPLLQSLFTIEPDSTRTVVSGGLRTRLAKSGEEFENTPWVEVEFNRSICTHGISTLSCLFAN